MADFTFDAIPDQSGRTALVTGANTGLGFETARALARKGADVILACRDQAKGRAAVERIANEAPKAKLTLEPLDLGDLASVAAFADKLAKARTPVDLLVNNAGVMVPPLARTKQGFELQMGTNHFGHFALTARLLPLLADREGARIVVVASHAQRMGRIAFEDLNWEKRRYLAWFAYGQSKLANMLFALELGRRLAKAGAKAIVTAAHPGWTSTELARNDAFARFWSPFLAMTTEQGALTTLRAATSPEATAGSYSGPTGLFGIWGKPGPASIPARARDEAVAAQLFAESERLTAVSFGLA